MPDDLDPTLMLLLERHVAYCQSFTPTGTIQDGRMLYMTKQGTLIDSLEMYGRIRMHRGKTVRKIQKHVAGDTKASQDKPKSQIIRGLFGDAIAMRTIDTTHISRDALQRHGFPKA